MRANQNFEAFRFSSFFFFLFFTAFPFTQLNYLLAAVSELLLGLLLVQEFTIKQLRDGKLWSAVEGNFALSLSLKFLSIFVHISRLIDPVTLIWVSLERSFPPAELEYK